MALIDSLTGYTQHRTGCAEPGGWISADQGAEEAGRMKQDQAGLPPDCPE